MEVVSEIKTNKNDLLKQIMELDFAAYELTLFLDTHPRDKKALELHKSVVGRSKALREQYVSMFGPLSPDESMNTEQWAWIEGPWPWENN